MPVPEERKLELDDEAQGARRPAKLDRPRRISGQAVQANWEQLRHQKGAPRWVSWASAEISSRPG